MPTSRAWTVLVGGAALLAAGFGAGYRELAVVGAAGVLCVLLAAGWVGSPPQLAAQRTIAPNRVHRGEDCQVSLTIRSTSRRVRMLTATEPVGGAVVSVPIRVDGGAVTQTSYPLPTDERGILMVGPLRIGRHDPLDLCRAQRQVAPATRVLVRPRRRQLRTLPLGASPNLDGLLDAAMHGSIAFHALREYRPGDDLRHVHWRTSARIGTLVVREHVDTALPRLAVLLDDDLAAYPAGARDFEEAVEAAAALLVTAGRDAVPVVLCTASRPGLVTTVDAGLDLLAQATLATEGNLAEAVAGLRREPAGDTLVVVAGPGTHLAPVLAVRDRYAAVVAAVLGQDARAPALPGDIAVLAAATAAEFVNRWDRTFR